MHNRSQKDTFDQALWPGFPELEVRKPSFNADIRQWDSCSEFMSSEITAVTLLDGGSLPAVGVTYTVLPSLVTVPLPLPMVGLALLGMWTGVMRRGR